MTYARPLRRVLSAVILTFFLAVPSTQLHSNENGSTTSSSHSVAAALGSEGRVYLPENYVKEMEELNEDLMEYLVEVGVKGVSGKVVEKIVEKAAEKVAAPIPPVLSVLALTVEVTETGQRLDKALTAYLGIYLNIEKKYGYPQLSNLTRNNKQAMQIISDLQEEIDQKVQAVFEYSERHPHLFKLKSTFHRGPLKDIPEFQNSIKRLDQALSTSGVRLSELETRAFSTAKGLMTCPIIKRNISIGDIDKNLPVAININDNFNLLGVDFFKAYNYTIDSRDSCIYIWSK